MFCFVLTTWLSSSDFHSTESLPGGAVFGRSVLARRLAPGTAVCFVTRHGLFSVSSAGIVTGVPGLAGPASHGCFFVSQSFVVGADDTARY